MHDFEMWNRPVALKVGVWLVFVLLGIWRWRDLGWGNGYLWFALGFASAVLAAIVHKPRPPGTHPHSLPPRDRERG